MVVYYCEKLKFDFPSLVEKKKKCINGHEFHFINASILGGWKKKKSNPFVIVALSRIMVSEFLFYLFYFFFAIVPDICTWSYELCIVQIR